MAWNYYNKNIRPLSALTGNELGRRVLITDLSEITKENIAADLYSQTEDFEFNARVIKYLDNYYRGDQPIKYRQKKIRPEINNKVVENHAYELVESKVADLFGEPVKYVLKNSEDEKKAEQLQKLNAYMDSEDKAEIDVEKGRWASICGTSYLYIGTNSRVNIMDETPFTLRVEDPKSCGVVYFSDDMTPAYCFFKRKDDKGTYYQVYTSTDVFFIRDNKVYKEDKNGYKMIPLIEYPNNARRISDIEITIDLTDELNRLQSDRANGLESFVQNLMVAINCDFSSSEYEKLRAQGLISVKDAADGRKADIRNLSEEMNQSAVQSEKDDVYQMFLLVQGKPGRQENSGGDTGQAVVLRNGYYDEDKRAELRIPTYKKSERMMLRYVLNCLRVQEQFDLKLSEIDIRPKRSKLENMMVKAQVLQILHTIGVDDDIAAKTVNLFPDVQEAMNVSRERMKKQFDSSNGLIETSSNTNTVNETVVE